MITTTVNSATEISQNSSKAINTITSNSSATIYKTSEEVSKSLANLTKTYNQVADLAGSAYNKVLPLYNQAYAYFWSTTEPKPDQTPIFTEPPEAIIPATNEYTFDAIKPIENTKNYRMKDGENGNENIWQVSSWTNPIIIAGVSTIVLAAFAYFKYKKGNENKGGKAGGGEEAIESYCSTISTSDDFSDYKYEISRLDTCE